MIKSRSIGTKFSKESQLLVPVARFAKLKGFGLQAVELPFYEYRIDLYGYSRRRNATVAIELKLTDWRRALRQALLYQLCSDLVYIAMPARSAKRVEVSELREYGIGLISINDLRICSCILPAVQHNEVRHFYRLTQVEFLKGTASA
jgi:hypothetical protein